MTVLATTDARPATDPPPPHTGNVDAMSGLPVFTISQCDGQVRIRSAVLDFWRNARTYNFTVVASVRGETGVDNAITARFVVTVRDINDAPVLADTTLTVRESDGAGTLVGLRLAPGNGPLVAVDPDVAQVQPATYAMVGGDATAQRLFTVDASGQVRVATGVNVGRFVGTARCSCSPDVINFEGISAFTLLVRAYDGLNPALFTTATITVAVNNTNDTPFVPDNQVLSVDESVAVALGTVVGTVIASDEDFGDALTYALLAVAGGKGSNAGVAAPDVPVASAPYSITPEGEVFVIRPLSFDALDPLTTVNGYATRAAHRLLVSVTDRAGATSLNNLTVLTLANITSNGVLGVVTGFIAPSGGMATTGDMVNITGDYLSLTSGVRARYGQTAWPRSSWYNATCIVARPAGGQSQPGMSATCFAPPGVGVDHVWEFLQGGSAIDVTGSVRPIAGYAAPVVNTVEGWVGTNPNAAATAGGEVMRINGGNFGPRGTPVQVTYANPSPLDPAVTITYTATLLNSTHDTVLFVTAPGVGPNIRVTVTVGGQTATSGSVVMAYAVPTITALSVPVGSPYNTSTLRGAGSDDFVVTGTNFGPLTLPGGAVYTPTVTYGGSGGDAITAQACTRLPATAHTTISCRTDVGAGVGLGVRMAVGVTGQASTVSASPVALSYLPPTITGVSGSARTLATPGGERVTLQGTGFGSMALFAGGFVTVSATYGPLPGANAFTATACAVERPLVTTQVACTSSAGTGTGFWWRVQVNGQWSAPFAPSLPSPLGYAPPVISSFDGATTEAATVGGDSVGINGLNFGADAARINVTYALTLRQDVPRVANAAGRNLSMPQVLYHPAMCSIATPHTRLLCTVVPGAGAGLSWSMTVDGQPSSVPLTAYAAPSIATLTVLSQATGTPVTAASTDGGDTLVVSGANFGPAAAIPTGGVPLVQASILPRRYTPQHPRSTPVPLSPSLWCRKLRGQRSGRGDGSCAGRHYAGVSLGAAGDAADRCG